MKTAAIGLTLTVVTTSILVAVWGSAALVPGLAFGGYATAAQVAAVAAVRRSWSKEFGKLLTGWAVGMSLRLLGVVLVAVAVSVDRVTFPPLPTAFGYLGVVVPLLYMELKLVR